MRNALAKSKVRYIPKPVSSRAAVAPALDAAEPMLLTLSQLPPPSRPPPASAPAPPRFSFPAAPSPGAYFVPIFSILAPNHDIVRPDSA